MQYATRNGGNLAMATATPKELILARPLHEYYRRELVVATSNAVWLRSESQRNETIDEIGDVGSRVAMGQSP